VGRPVADHSYRVLQAREGPVPAPQWDDHDPTNRVNRPITHLEAARLQGFPDDFRWCGSKIGIAKQIGNAVPVGLAHALAEHLKPHLAQRRTRRTRRHLTSVPAVA